MSLSAVQLLPIFDNIQAQIQASVNQVQSDVDQILSIPSDQQTFENTLGVWDRIREEIQTTSTVLNDQMKADFSDKDFARESIQEYQSFIDAIYLHHAELYYPLFSYAKKALVEDNLRTSVQRRIAHLLGVYCEQFSEDMSWEDQEILATLIKLKARNGISRARQDARLPRREIHPTEEECVIPCGEVSANARGDSNGNASAGVSANEKSDDGKWSVEAHMEVNRDSQGNVTTSGGGSVTYHFGGD